MARDWALMLIAPAALTMVTPAGATDYLTTQAAQKVLFPEATGFEKVTVTLSKDQLKAIKKLAHVRQRNDEPPVWRAMGPEGTLGWLFVDEVVGKHEYITYAIALSPDGKVLGIEIMSYRETHGDEVRRDAWRAQFDGKTLHDELKLGDDISNISGATLSCRNITDGVRRILALQEVAKLHD